MPKHQIHDESTLGQVITWAITWANVDPVLCRHMASLGPNELIDTENLEWIQSFSQILSENFLLAPFRVY